MFDGLFDWLPPNWGGQPKWLEALWDYLWVIMIVLLGGIALVVFLVTHAN